MAYKPKSFEEFYFEGTNEIYDIDYLINHVNMHDGKLDKYDHHMYCPECFKAELYFVHQTSKRRAHLRRCPSSKHEDGCSYNYQYASKKLLKKYFESLDYSQIQDKLNSIINMLCKISKEIDNIRQNETVRPPQDNPMLILQEESADKNFKSLRRKKLSTFVDETDREKLFIFYGKVKLKVSRMETPEGELKFYALKVYNSNLKMGWKFRTSIYRGQTQDLIDEASIYYIAIVGYVGEKGWQIKMPNINALKYHKVED